MGVIRERESERTADDRVIEAELHPPHRAVHPSRLLTNDLGFQELAAALTPSTLQCYCNNVGY